MPLARIGLGANLGDAEATVRSALADLGTLGTVVRASALYRSKAWGVEEQPDFVNAAALLRTELEPRALLAALKSLEEKLGRRPGARWGPRAIDLDILAYDDRALDEPDLIIPHRHLHERAFALVPLAQIDPAYQAACAALPENDRASVLKIEPS